MKKILCFIFAIAILLCNFNTVNAFSDNTKYNLEGNAQTYTKMTCGNEEIPYVAAQITRTVVLVLQIVTPLVIIVLGMVDLFKAMIAQKEDEIKKGQQTFIRRLGLGALVFLIFVIVELIIRLVATDAQNDNMWKCTNCFINGKCEELIINQ